MLGAGFLDAGVATDAISEVVQNAIVAMCQMDWSKFLALLPSWLVAESTAKLLPAIMKLRASSSSSHHIPGWSTDAFSHHFAQMPDFRRGKRHLIFSYLHSE